ncbi:MAG TPA: hypothetical protein P5525_22705, partial [Candidatus Paceibacterota bacterium]|nr:hypothetical protein [Candidatus Paceibacterota bacterium]
EAVVSWALCAMLGDVAVNLLMNERSTPYAPARGRQAICRSDSLQPPHASFLTVGVLGAQTLQDDCDAA